jgi:bifunctional non-homologous end joining protein LigD
MECQSVTHLPEGEQWVYEIKQDSYRAETLIDGSTVTLLSISGLNFNERFPQIVESLKWLKLGSAVLDGELVALDEQGKPSFNDIQNWRTKRPIVYYVFDVLHLHGKDLLDVPLNERKERLQELCCCLHLSGLDSASPSTLMNLGDYPSDVPSGTSLIYHFI